MSAVTESLQSRFTDIIGDHTSVPIPPNFRGSSYNSPVSNHKSMRRYDDDTKQQSENQTRNPGTTNDITQKVLWLIVVVVILTCFMKANILLKPVMDSFQKQSKDEREVILSDEVNDPLFQKFA